MKAAIDIGTNTALLLVAEVDSNTLEVLHEEQRVPRLGKGVDGTRNISAAAMNRLIAALREYKEIINKSYPSVSSILVTATSAMRDAQNRNNFLNTIRVKTGFEVEVLSGVEEAKYTFKGALIVLDTDIASKQNVVIDIGGGSTEVASGSGTEIRDRHSFDMGCVRFTERYLQDNPPTEMQISVCKEAIQQKLKEYEFNFIDSSALIGVAGTVTSLAYIDKQARTYDSRGLNGHPLSLQKIREYIHLFKNRPSEELLKKYPVVMEGRADIFLSGLLILEGFMHNYGFDELITSPGGIRHGAILEAKNKGIEENLSPE